MRIKYKLAKKNIFRNYISINISKSYNVNKKLDEESLGLIKFYDEELINKAIKRKIDIKFKYIFELMLRIEEDDSDPSEGLMICLNELDKLKKEIINKYHKFLDKKKQEFLRKKIMLLENEIKMKLFNMQIIRTPIIMNGSEYQDVPEDNLEKESARRR